MATVANPFLRLNILRDKLDDAIEDFFFLREENCTYGKIGKCNGDRYRLEYTVNGSQEKLDFRFNKDNTTSFDLNPGGKTPFKEELATSLKNSSICTLEKLKGFKNPYFVVKGIKSDDVETTLALIIENDNVFLEKHYTVAGGKRWVILNREGERVTVTYYFKSEKSLIQGKPLKLFNEVYTTLMLLIEIDEMPKVMEENLEMNTSTHVSKNEIIDSLDQYVPDAAPHLNNKLKKILYQSIFNLRVNMEMFEYSFLAFPSLKALEGHLKYIMKDESIPSIDKKFSMFEKLENGKYILQEEHKKNLDLGKIDAIHGAYNFYNKNRHSIFHWAEVDTRIPLDRTRMIDNIAEARSIISNVFEIINDYYKK